MKKKEKKVKKKRKRTEEKNENDNVNTTVHGGCLAFVATFVRECPWFESNQAHFFCDLKSEKKYWQAQNTCS